MRFLKSSGALVVLVLMAQPAGAGWGAPAPTISLEKTVGTDESVCATTDAITVTAGTDVTYCYRMTNNTNVTLTTHDLFDNQLGILLLDDPTVVAIGASFAVTATTTIASTTVNIATWTASTSPLITITARTADVGGAAQGPGITPAFVASDSAIVNVLIPATEPDAGPDGCTDGIDNDQDGAIDCGDVDCVSVGPCVSPAPALGPGGLVVAGLMLLSIGAGSLLLRRRP